MLPNFGTYGPAVVIGAMINKGGIGYGMTRYGWIADMVLGLEVILANGETILIGRAGESGNHIRAISKMDSSAGFARSVSPWLPVRWGSSAKFVCAPSKPSANGCTITVTPSAAINCGKRRTR